MAVLVDTAFFRAVRSIMSAEQRTTTIELKVNFLESANSGRLTATARIISNRDRLTVADVEVTSDDGRLVAQGLGTFLIIGSGGIEPGTLAVLRLKLAQTTLPGDCLELSPLWCIIETAQAPKERRDEDPHAR